MKIKHLLISLSAVALFSCGGGQNNGGGADSQAPAIDTISAFELFKKFNPELAEQYKDADTLGKLFFTFYDPEGYSEYGGSAVNLYYSNISDGGNLIIYQVVENDMLDDYVSDFHLFRYVNGELSEAKDLLPAPTIDDFAEVDGLTFYNATDDVKEYIAEKQFKYSYLPETGLLMTQICVFNDDITLYYKWDGSKFAPDPTHDPESPQNIISYIGVGQIFLGDNPPENIVGYQKTTFGNMVYYNRDGKKALKLSLDKDGKIDTITVLSPMITFRIDCDGPTNDHFGVGFKPVDFCSSDNFEFKDGCWVRSFHGTYNHYCGLMYSSDPYADSLVVVDFYTTKNAITNLYPEIGKKVSWRDDPKYDPNATVTQIKIYHRQPEPALDEAHIAKQVWYAWLEGDDPIGIAEPDQKPSDEIIAANRKRVKEHSATVAEFIAEGVEGFSETIACYKYTQGDKSGKWLVLKYLDGRGGGNTVTVYDYDGKEFNRLDNYFSADFLRDVYLAEFAADGFLSYEDSNGNSDEILYKWNGVKFVK